MMPSSRAAPLILYKLASVFALSVLAACGHRNVAEQALVIYDASKGESPRGWSHIVSDPSGFPGLAHAPEAYAVDRRSLVSDRQLDGEQVFRSVLVRKLSDWDRQHANGLEPVFTESPIRVGDLRAVRVILRIDSSDSRIPDLNTIRSHYEEYLEPDQIAELDEGIPCLGFTFLEAGYNDQSGESLNAFYFVRFDPEKDCDRWLEIEVPLADFTFAFEKDYKLREVRQEDVAELAFVAFRVNPEATGGKVARHSLNQEWDGSVPELYKETSISLRRIEAVLASEGE